MPFIKEGISKYRTSSPTGASQSDASIVVKVVDLINMAMGPTEKNTVNFKMIQTILHILARNMRLLDQSVELRNSDIAPPAPSTKETFKTSRPVSKYRENAVETVKEKEKADRDKLRDREETQRDRNKNKTKDMTSLLSSSSNMDEVERAKHFEKGATAESAHKDNSSQETFKASRPESKYREKTGGTAKENEKADGEKSKDRKETKRDRNKNENKETASLLSSSSNMDEIERAKHFEKGATTESAHKDNFQQETFKASRPESKYREKTGETAKEKGKTDSDNSKNQDGDKNKNETKDTAPTSPSSSNINEVEWVEYFVKNQKERDEKELAKLKKIREVYLLQKKKNEREKAKKEDKHIDKERSLVEKREAKFAEVDRAEERKHLKEKEIAKYRKKETPSSASSSTVLSIMNDSSDDDENEMAVLLNYEIEKVERDGKLERERLLAKIAKIREVYLGEKEMEREKEKANVANMNDEEGDKYLKDKDGRKKKKDRERYEKENTKLAKLNDTERKQYLMLKEKASVNAEDKYGAERAKKGESLSKQSETNTETIEIERVEKDSQLGLEEKRAKIAKIREVYLREKEREIVKLAKMDDREKEQYFKDNGERSSAKERDGHEKEMEKSELNDIERKKYLKENEERENAELNKRERYEKYIANVPNLNESDREKTLKQKEEEEREMTKDRERADKDKEKERKKYETEKENVEEREKYLKDKEQRKRRKFDAMDSDRSEGDKSSERKEYFKQKKEEESEISMLEQKEKEESEISMPGPKNIQRANKETERQQSEKEMAKLAKVNNKEREKHLRNNEQKKQSKLDALDIERSGSEKDEKEKAQPMMSETESEQYLKKKENTKLDAKDRETEDREKEIEREKYQKDMEKFTNMDDEKRKTEIKAKEEREITDFYAEEKQRAETEIDEKGKEKAKIAKLSESEREKYLKQKEKDEREKSKIDKLDRERAVRGKEREQAEKEQEKQRDKEQEKDSELDREYEQEKERDKEHEKLQDKEHENDQNKEHEIKRETEREKGHERDVEQEKDRKKGEKKREKELEKEGEKERIKEGEKQRDKKREKGLEKNERENQQEIEREKERDEDWQIERERGKERERDIKREREKEREREMERERESERDIKREQDIKRERETEREREKESEREKEKERETNLKEKEWAKGKDSRTRVGSIEVVTRSEFELLEAKVNELQEKTAPIPYPSMPDNEKLRTDLARGSASLTDTMQAMQVSARVQATETAMSRMADLLTQLAAAGALPRDVVKQVGEVTAGMGRPASGKVPGGVGTTSTRSSLSRAEVAKRRSIGTSPWRGQSGTLPRDGGDESTRSVIIAIDASTRSVGSVIDERIRSIGIITPIVERTRSVAIAEDSLSRHSIGTAISTVGVERKKYSGGLTTASRAHFIKSFVTHPELDDAQRQLKDEMIKKINNMVLKALRLAEIADVAVGRVCEQMDIATRVAARIDELFSLVSDYAEQLSGFDAGVSVQLQNFNEQIFQIRCEVNDGIVLFNQTVSNSETEAVKELKTRYEDLVIDLDDTKNNIEKLDYFQNAMGDEITSLLNGVEAIREQKADRDELLDGIHDKADKSRLEGLIKDLNFEPAHIELEKRLEHCFTKFKNQDEVWIQVLEDLNKFAVSKASGTDLFSFSYQAEIDLNKLKDELQSLATTIAAPKAILLARKISEGGTCGPCQAPALQEPTADCHPLWLPAMRRHPPEAEEPCVQPVKEPRQLGEREHICKRWAGGSHTLITKSVVHQDSGDIRVYMPPTKKYAGIGRDGKLYQLEEPLQPCADCKKLDIDEKTKVQEQGAGEPGVKKMEINLKKT